MVKKSAARHRAIMRCSPGNDNVSAELSSTSALTAVPAKSVRPPRQKNATIKMPRSISQRIQNDLKKCMVDLASTVPTLSRFHLIEQDDCDGTWREHKT